MIELAAPLRIALLAHVRHPIHPPYRGGMEAHSAALGAALAARGHHVTMFASGDTATDLPLHPIVPEHYDRAYPWHDFHGTDALNRHLDAIFATAGRDLLAGGYDLMHNNSLHRFAPRMARARRQPTVTSLHVPPFAALQRAVHDSAAPWHCATATSQAHRAMWWPDGAPGTALVVHNGIDPADWPFVPTGDGTAVWSGRITPNKGTHLAIAAARIAGLPLTLFGVVEHADYFEQKVRPHLGPDIRYGGHLTGRVLAGEIGRASLLFFTPMWEEPFGLAAIEAMSCGLPVAATDRGAVREVIGPCGVYTAAPDAAFETAPDTALALALAQAAEAAMALPRAASRARVLARFTTARMVAGYETLYRRVIAHRDDPAAPCDYDEIELTIAG